MLAAAVTVAQAATTTTTGSPTDPTPLPELVSMLPPCGFRCLDRVKTEIGCGVADVKCLCETPNEFFIKMGFCIQFNSDCSDKDTKVAREVAGQFCDVAGQSPSQDTLASVSSIITGGVAKATATSSSSSASTNAAGVVEKGIQMAVYVAAAAAVL
ncbi:hypothetical protein CPLU01_06287 [Colletotrichum plurivorum]|uniref:CFEM domain-containing protein n=1 Tax=Colletotrichum plurivorum TaxID=2175906 RepID=A0A8H6NGN6_9PEZI|nr:hypothetical protein CPLU01_06287 [Colletotrichum plurivorum]